MYESALGVDYTFQIRPDTRTFDYQKVIWEREWNGDIKVDRVDISKTIADPKACAFKTLE